jgi:hypothetical protein
MREIVADVTGAKTRDDVYSALFRAWEAPDWHGQNFNALRDSLIVGDINRIEPPFRLKIVGVGSAGADALGMVSEFEDLINKIRPELSAEGRSIELQIDR